MLMFPLVWINLVLEKTKGISLGFLCAAFWGVTLLVYHVIH